MLLATFCLRLACGMAAALLLLSPDQISPCSYRAHFLTILGLSVLAALVGPAASGWGWWVALGSGMVLAFVGFLVWSLERVRGRRSLIALLVLTQVATLFLMLPVSIDARERASFLVDDLTSAALLGAATTAMLIAHSYLIAPTMSLTPLLRLLTVLFVVTLLRMVVAGVDLWSWTDRHSLTNLESVAVLWLPVRWGVGFAGVLILGWMARESARIRSTQSATGILYVVVIFCFLGELTSQLLLTSSSPAQ